jgi:hypothetical protein
LTSTTDALTPAPDLLMALAMPLRVPSPAPMVTLVVAFAFGEKPLVLAS